MKRVGKVLAGGGRMSVRRGGGRREMDESNRKGEARGRRGREWRGGEGEEDGDEGGSRKRGIH